MIIIINPNSTEAMTDSMVRAAANVGVEVTGWTSRGGPAAIQGPEDGAAAIPPLLTLVERASHAGASAIIIGCFDDTGLNQARAIADCPVIGIGQAAYFMAALVGARFSVVTTLDVSVPILERNIRLYGLSGSLARVRASGVPVLQLETDPEGANPRIMAEIAQAIAEDDIESIVLGCAGMVDIADLYGPDLPVRLIDGVRAAAKLATVLSV